MDTFSPSPVYNSGDGPSCSARTSCENVPITGDASVPPLHETTPTKVEEPQSDPRRSGWLRPRPPTTKAPIYEAPAQHTEVSVTHAPPSYTLFLHTNGRQYIRTSQGNMGVSIGTHLVFSSLPDDMYVLAPRYKRRDALGHDFQPGLLTGSVKQGEAPVHAAMREMGEELGLYTTATPRYVKTFFYKRCVWYMYTLPLSKTTPYPCGSPEYIRSTRTTRSRYSSFSSTSKDCHRSKIVLVVYGSKKEAAEVEMMTRDVERQEHGIVGTEVLRVGTIRDAFFSCGIV